jgi:TetR/AcrR family transcriptional regulator, ethionamide resistance regulator
MSKPPARGRAAVVAPAEGFATILGRHARAAGLRKTERTRLRLLAAVAERLEAGDEQAALRVSDIAAAAGLAHGTFYRYFPDRSAAVEALLADFALHLRDSMAAARDGAPGSRERVEATTLAYLRQFRANLGLMRCLMDLGRDSAAFRARFHAFNRTWNGRVAATIARRRAELSGRRPAPAAALLPTAYALGGMIDEFLSQLYLRRDPALKPLAGDETAVTALLTDLWCRAAYGNAPL